MINLSEIKLSEVDTVYVGKPDKCMCGCSGKYTYTSVNQKQSTKRRGYEVTDDEVNDKRVMRIVKKVSQDEKEVVPPNAETDNIDNRIFTRVIGKTQYTIYLTDEIKEECVERDGWD